MGKNCERRYAVDIASYRIKYVVQWCRVDKNCRFGVNESLVLKFADRQCIVTENL
jgi:hypothetical protein